MNFRKIASFITVLIMINASSLMYAKENTMIYKADHFKKDQKMVPPIDMTKPQNLETATFALG